MKPKNESRREFLRKGFIKKALLISELTSNLQETEEPSEKIKMLAPDGSLVEVDATAITKSKSIKKASPEDIHHWIDTKKKK